MIKCLSIYLNVPLNPQQLVNTLLHQAFITNGPTIDEPLETLQLNPHCFECGAIRLWTYNLHINDDTIPEKAKTFYREQPRRMKQLLEQVCFESLDMYTVAHLFGDMYRVNVYINDVHVQEAAGMTLDQKPWKHTVKLKHDNGVFKLIQKVKQKQRRPSFTIYELKK